MNVTLLGSLSAVQVSCCNIAVVLPPQNESLIFDLILTVTLDGAIIPSRALNLSAERPSRALIGLTLRVVP